MTETVKQAMAKPWRCPSCTKRFKTKEKLHKHFDEFKTCGDYAQEGLELIDRFAKGEKRIGLQAWKERAPHKILERGI